MSRWQTTDGWRRGQDWEGSCIVRGGESVRVVRVRVWEVKSEEWEANEWRVNEWRGYKWRVNEWRGYKWRVNEWRVNNWRVNEWRVNHMTSMISWYDLYRSTGLTCALSHSGDIQVTYLYIPTHIYITYPQYPSGAGILFPSEREGILHTD